MGAMLASRVQGADLVDHALAARCGWAGSRRAGRRRCCRSRPATSSIISAVSSQPSPILSPVADDAFRLSSSCSRKRHGRRRSRTGAWRSWLASCPLLSSQPRNLCRRTPAHRLAAAVQVDVSAALLATQYCTKPIRPGQVDLAVLAGQELFQVVVAQGRVFDVDFAHHADLDLRARGVTGMAAKSAAMARRTASSSRLAEQLLSSRTSRWAVAIHLFGHGVGVALADPHRGAPGCAASSAGRRRSTPAMTLRSSGRVSGKPLSFSRPEKFSDATGILP